MSAICNVGSLLLGVMACLLPIAALRSGRRRKINSLYFVSSISCCAGAFLLTLLEINHRIFIGDFSALMDTTDFVVRVSAALWAVTVLLNVIVYMAQKEGTREKQD